MSDINDIIDNDENNFHLNVYSDNNHTYKGYTADELRLMVYRINEDDDYYNAFYDAMIDYCMEAFNVEPAKIDLNYPEKRHSFELTASHFAHMVSEKIYDNRINEIITIMENSDMNPHSETMNVNKELNSIGINTDYESDELLMAINDEDTRNKIMIDYIAAVMRAHGLDSYRLSANIDKLQFNDMSLIARLYSYVLTVSPESDKAKNMIINSPLYADIDDSQLAKAKNDELKSVMMIAEGMMNQLTDGHYERIQGMTIHGYDAIELIKTLTAGMVCLSADDMPSAQILMTETSKNFKYIINDEPDKVNPDYNAFINDFISLLKRGITVNDEACLNLMKSYALTASLSNDFPDFNDTDDK